MELNIATFSLILDLKKLFMTINKSMEVLKFVVKGERCCGTNYLEKLIETNLRITPYKTPEWKHGYFGLSVTDRVGIDYLTVIIFRNVFDWLRSLYYIPYHLEGAEWGRWTDKPTFSEFIRREVKMFSEDGNSEKNMDRHPLTLEHPKNLLELRKWKNENFLSYKKLSKPVYYVKYEDLFKNPENIIREINEQYFNVDFVFENWTFYKGDKSRKYNPKKYFDISLEDQDYLIKNVDWELERKIGYSCKKPE